MMWFDRTFFDGFLTDVADGASLQGAHLARCRVQGRARNSECVQQAPQTPGPPINVRRVRSRFSPEARAARRGQHDNATDVNKEPNLRSLTLPRNNTHPARPSRRLSFTIARWWWRHGQARRGRVGVGGDPLGLVGVLDALGRPTSSEGGLPLTPTEGQ